ncbi:DNA polymerase III subunit gamma/tau [Aurantibacillus circumpalustris]|uniref:DNA polymerase III subunit gamma/tau n=1 Tax=Aurantibacillus circumpalustris TaxID=3036359 RepID=UPI00295AE5C9|nr:DNA polymerase III subunit gamma/tau [Aurantibacillus circumpalustris]
MDNFIVSARKYRPQLFNTVVGQSHITNTLKNAIITKHLAQAYLFCGPRGVGKTTCARIFAKTINCTNVSKDGEACDTCESCVSFNSGASLNVYELDAASNNSVDDIRNLVDQVRFAPQLGEYKVYVIDEVHMLSTAAFNAFLKTLEEPPKHAKFILATTEKHKIIPTILSRCQVFNFNRIKTEDISNHLAFMAKSEDVSYEEEALHVIAQKADGGLRDACSIFDQMVAFTGNHLTYKQVVENLNVLDYDYYFKMTDAFLSQGLPEVMMTFDDILKKGFDGHNFLLGLGEHLRNLMVSKDPQTISLMEVSESLKQRYSIQSQQCSLTFLLKSLALISKTDVNYKIAKNQRLLVEMALMQLTFLTASPEAEKKNDELESEEENTSQPTKTITSSSTKVTALQEPEIKFASKPSVGFDQLKIKASFSLHEVKNYQTLNQTSNTNAVEAPEVKFVNKEVNLDDVKAAIKSYADEKQKQGARQLATIFNTSSIEFTDNTIELTISNETQKEQLLIVKQDFVDTIRKLLQNNSIAITIQISAVEAQTKAYKPIDIFKAMSEKNPALLELKKRFDLEIDY